MPALLIYLLKVNVALLLFCLGYYTVLRRLTFYTLNRVYLILAIVFCSLYPAINFTGVVQNHQQLAKPLQVIIIDLGNRAQNISKPITQTDYWQWAVVLFWVGVGLMTIRLIVQFFSLFNLYRRSKPGLVNEQQVRLMSHDSNPFSFWQHIYINPELHSETELNSIIAHEQIHVKQWHTLDVLLAELSLIFYWFNPGVWMMKKAISENLEFITDRKILQQGTDAKSYQYSLLYTCVNTSSNVIVNHFNISTIKKRIMMMNSKKSATYNITRYTFIVPAILVLLLAFGTSKAALVSKGIHMVTKATHEVIGNIATSAKKDTAKFRATQTAFNQSELTAAQINGTVGLSPDSGRHPIKNVLSMVKKAGMTDSSYYEVNGKQATPAQISALNPGDIVKVNIIDSKTAYPKLMPFGSKGAVFIVTKDGQSQALTKHMLHKIDMIVGYSNDNKREILLNKSDTMVHINSNGKIGYGVIRSDKKTNTINGVATSGYSEISDKPLTVDIKGYGNEKPVRMTAGEVIIKTDTMMTVSPDGKMKYKARADYVYSPPSSTGISSPINMRINPNQGVYPLIVIDNKVATHDAFQALQPDKIDHILYLKDSSATKIYGNKASEGALLITTKGTKKQ
jgi:bla regulator protein blaR1